MTPVGPASRQGHLDQQVGRAYLRMHTEEGRAMKQMPDDVIGALDPAMPEAVDLSEKPVSECPFG